MKSFLEQVESWEVITLLVCGLVLGLYFLQKVDLENMFKKDSPVPVHMEGIITPSQKLQEVQVLDIPDFVYATLPKDGQFKRYLTGNHKYVLFFTYPGCPYARAFDRAFRYLFEEGNFEQYYRKRIIKVGQTTTISCPGHQDMNCATAWVYQTCFGKVCIFHPQLKQVVVSASQNARQIEPLLQTYLEW